MEAIEIVAAIGLGLTVLVSLARRFYQSTTKSMKISLGKTELLLSAHPSETDVDALVEAFQDDLQRQKNVRKRERRSAAN